MSDEDITYQTLKFQTEIKPTFRNLYSYIMSTYQNVYID